MKYEIKVPAMGESITEATVGNILKPTGSKVSMDDEILELETDKVNQVLYASQTGVVTWNVNQEDTVKIGQVLGFIDSEGKGQSPSEPPKKEEEKAKPQEKKEEKVERKEPEKRTEPQARPSEPAAASVSSIRHSKDDYIRDVMSPKHELPTMLAEPREVKPKKDTSERKESRKKLSKIRKVIANRLIEVQQSTAMLTTFNEVDLTEVIALREKYKDSFTKRHGAKLGFMSFFVKAAVAALEEFPQVNSYIDGDDLVHREYFDIGIAVSTDRGLIVPVVKDCNYLSFAGIETAIEQFAKKARDGNISVDDLQGGGFTITNGGIYGSLLSTPILNPLQCAILGMHKIAKRPVVVNDQIVIRPMMYLALSYDHRIIDGKEAVSFLVHIKNSLEDPSRLLLDL